MPVLEQYCILIVGSGGIGRKLAVYANHATSCLTLVSGLRRFDSERCQREWQRLSIALGDRLIYGAFELIAPRTIKLKPFTGGPERFLIGNRVFIDLDSEDLDAWNHEVTARDTSSIGLYQSLGLAEAAVELDSDGRILVDEHLETTSPNTWAMGKFAADRLMTRDLRCDLAIVKTHALPAAG